MICQWLIILAIPLSSVQAIGERIHFIGEQLISSNESITGNSGYEFQDDTQWEYEPRIWTPEEVPSWSEDLEELNTILAENSQHPLALLGAGQAKIKIKQQEYKQQVKNNNSNSIRDRNYFWDSRRRRHYGKLDVEVPTTQRQASEKCNQFRVDIRETVICDKQRCDKLDFEWPRHDNQLVLMESTRHGMRFHRSDYQIIVGPSTMLRNQQQQQVEPSNGQTKIAPPPPIKFDLFDFLKPKPSQKPPPWAIFQQSTTTTTAPAITTSKATEAPSGGDTSPASTEAPSGETETETETSAPTEATTEATTAASTSMTTTESSSSEDTQTTASIRDIPIADNNQTQFVTTFRVNTKRRKQSILGFGGALSDSTCRNIKSLSPTMARSLMEDYYGSRGLRYNIARMSMGSSDFSTTPYTNNDRTTGPPTATPIVIDSVTNDDEHDPFDDRRNRRQAINDYQSDDLEMKNFRLVDEDYEFKLPVARQAIATSQQKIKFYSSLWSPPIWMKNNSHIVHGYLKGDVYGPYYKALAELIVKWLEAYRKQGIEFWATTGLNEPVTGIKPFIFHNSLGITRDDYVTFIKLYLGPLLRQRGFADLKLIALDDNKGYAQKWVKAVLDDKEAAQYIAGIGVHWYMNDEYENLNFLARDYPDKFILSTEACNGYLPFQVHTLPGDWDRGVAYMYDIVKLMQKNVAGWVDWNMVLDLYGGPSWAKNNLDAPIIVNAERDEYYKSPMFYALGHFSRFVEPNSTRLDHRLAYANYDYPLEAVAYLTPRDYIVTVVLNANHHKVPFRLIVDRQVIRVIDLKPDSFSTIIFKLKKKVG